MTTKFLVAVDGSEPAQRAVAYAIRLTKDCSVTSLHLLSVTPDPAAGEEQAAARRGQDLLDPAVQMVRAAGIAHTSEHVTGGLAGQIVKRADELGCDGIVMGTHGATAIGNLLMGSVATEVVHLSKLPVTLVR